MFSFSERSLENLGTVKPELQELANLALECSTVDFAVIEGIRTLETQKEYVEKGVSRTMNSKHLTGDAVDLMAYVGSRPSWELPLYLEIANAVQEAARQLEINVRWGGAWTVPNLRTWAGDAYSAHSNYLYYCNKRSKKAFIDGPHFELVSVA